MNSHCSLSWMNYYLNWINYYLMNWIIPTLIVIVIALFFLLLIGKKAKKANSEIYERSWTNQKEMISILKEIRDLLKK